MTTIYRYSQQYTAVHQFYFWEIITNLQFGQSLFYCVATNIHAHLHDVINVDLVLPRCEIHHKNDANFFRVVKSDSLFVE